MTINLLYKVRIVLQYKIQPLKNALLNSAPKMTLQTSGVTHLLCPSSPSGSDDITEVSRPFALLQATVSDLNPFCLLPAVDNVIILTFRSFKEEITL